MLKKKSNWFIILMVGLLIYGSVMIVSAELGNHVGDTDAFIDSAIKQLEIVGIGAIFFGAGFALKFDHKILNVHIYQLLYIGVIILLLIPRILGKQTNGAYAWIDIGFSFQPSEFAKVFSIVAGARILSVGYRNKDKRYFYGYAGMELLLVGIIALIQNDTGTALILLGISYCILFVTTSSESGTRKMHNLMMWGIIGVVILVGILFIPQVNDWLKEHFDGYMIGRVLSANNPFADQYDTGYHLVMSLTAIATGGWKGLGYGQSIHKFMNFPNPSSDFILAVIIEENGILGFIILCAFYLGIMAALASDALKTTILKRRIIYLGTFIYFFLHFVLNVGGVTALIPLTGVPLLMVSSGGSSTIAALMMLGFCIRQMKDEEYENNCRKVQEVNA